MTKLLQLVQIGKRALAMDDDVYRDMLENLTGQRSARGLNDIQLDKVLVRMKALGFKPTPKRPAARPRAEEVTKIKAIWLTMHQQGFVRTPNDSAIDAYVKRMTSQTNGKGIAKAAWLTSSAAAPVLEALKKWHYRLMKEAILAKGDTLPQNDSRTGPAGYDKLADHYAAHYTG